jgi:hypothetical protein
MTGIPPARALPRRVNDWEYRNSNAVEPGQAYVTWYGTNGTIVCAKETQAVLSTNPDAVHELQGHLEEAVLNMPKTIVRDYTHHRLGAKPVKVNQSTSEMRDLKVSISTLIGQLNGAAKPLPASQVKEFTRKFAECRDQMRVLRDLWTEVEANFEMAGIKLVDVIGEGE